MAVRALPNVSSLTEQQQRGRRCTWCGYPLAPGTDVDLGEQRATAKNGAAYSWFPRACADTGECAQQEARTRR
ncbi:hypothetical protein [Streptomyces sp. NPDC091416]|uniref:hypothetical protein n=1 Tax=Streptomyces sp. NPDC091416 TaxID=3366003 RepID=UPI0038126032